MPWLRLVVATLLAFTPAIAAADSTTPITVMIGPEVRAHLTEATEAHDRGFDPSSTSRVAGGLFATVGYSVSPGIALGIHTGLASRRASTGGADGHLAEQFDNRRILTDVAATLQLTVGRLWVAPWLGRHITRLRIDAHVCARDLSSEPFQCHESSTVEWTDDFTTFGATAGIDLVRSGAHNVAGFVDAQAGLGTYSGISVGIGYRLDFGAARAP